MIVIIALLLSFGCKKNCFDDEFTIVQSPYYGNELRIDGYYYTGTGDNTSVIVLFKNGVIFYGGSGRDLAGFEELFHGKEFVEGEKDNPFCWGLYEIRNDTINYESNTSYGQPWFYVYKTSALIKNDTTFHVFERMRSNGTEKEELDYSYHFKQFSPKPDSTNNFFK